MNKKFYERERERERVKRFLKNRGFTLIELLVVISIIGFLATASMVVFNSVRSKARDSRRLSDLKQIRSALELYYDTNNTYPAAYYSGGVCNSGLNEYGDGWCRDTTNNNGLTPIINWIPGLETYLPSMPHNPKPYYSGGSWPYHYLSDGQRYWLMVQLENVTPQTCSGGASYIYMDGRNGCAMWGGNLYAVTNY